MVDDQMKNFENRLKALEGGTKSLQHGLIEISEIKEDIKQIKNFILGDKEYEQDGLLREHKDMYSSYNTFKPEFTTVFEMIIDYKNQKFLRKYFVQIVTAVGVVNIISFVVYIINFFKAL